MNYIYEPELYHHGIKGQKWGVRRYQNEDGSLTSLGRKHVNEGTDNKSAFKRMVKKDWNGQTAEKTEKNIKSFRKNYVNSTKDINKNLKSLKKDFRKGKLSEEEYRNSLNDIAKKQKNSQSTLKRKITLENKKTSITKTAAVRAGKELAKVALAAGAAVVISKITKDSLSKAMDKTDRMILEYANDSFGISSLKSNAGKYAKNVAKAAAAGALAGAVRRAMPSVQWTEDKRTERVTKKANKRINKAINKLNKNSRS